MKKTAIIGITLLLSACASETYITDVTSESYQQDYTPDIVSKPIMASENAVVEKDVTPTVVKMTAEPEEKRVVKLTPKQQVKPVKVMLPSKPKEQPVSQSFGYTIQVVAVSSENKVAQVTNALPQKDQPIWENQKIVNGSKWYSILYGDYSTVTEAKQAISTLPAQFQRSKPFIKSIDSIKNSEYPTLNKLN